MRFPQDVPTLTDTDGPEPITIRAHREEDVEAAYEQCVDPLSQAWTTVPIPYTREHAKRFVREAMPGGWRTEQEWAFAVEYLGDYAGTISLRDEGEGRAEIAYGSHPRIRGTGGMERALRLLLEWGFAERGLQTVVWWANRGNWASRRVAWRLGFDIGPNVLRQWLPQRGALLDAWVGTLLATDERRPRHPWPAVPTIASATRPILLREAGEADLPRVVEACQDPATRRWLSGLSSPYDDRAAREALQRDLEQRASGTGLAWAVASTEDDRLLADVGLFNLSAAAGRAEIGYWVHPDARGDGVATEAVRLASRHALLPEEDGGLGLVRVSAHAAVDNTASRAVLRAAGFSEVGVERLGTRTGEGPADAVLFDRVASDLTE